MTISRDVLWDNNPTDLPDDPAFDDEAQELLFVFLHSIEGTPAHDVLMKDLTPDEAEKYQIWLQAQG